MVWARRSLRSEKIQLGAANVLENNVVLLPHEVKKLFMNCGTCSQTFFHLMNREFGHPGPAEERASDPLAGGLMNKQHQCGMLWGATLAVGAESCRRHDARDQAVVGAMTATMNLVDSFSERARGVNCREITCDFSDTIQLAAFMLKSLPGGITNMICMNLAEKWAPEAIHSARTGLSDTCTEVPLQPVNCASEIAIRMGAGDKEVVTVAGLAGGMGLSGNACGALGAAIWLDSLAWCREHPGQSGYSNPNAEEIMKAFYTATDSTILCSEISGQSFKTIGDHASFIRNGGCDNLLKVLSRSVSPLET